MSLVVHPDPQEPAGGFAFLELPDGSLRGESATVAVFDAYGERWLAASEGEGARVAVGDPHWQSERFEFGPYTVYRHEGADWVRIGPEIVNKIEEYAPLRIAVGEAEFDVTWPDDVPPRAGAAVLGGIRPVTKTAKVAEGPALVGRRELSVEDVDLVPDTVVPQPPRSPEPEPEPVERRNLLPWLVLLLVAAAIGAAAWWYWDDLMALADKGEAAPVVTEQAEPDQCTRSAIASLEGFAAVGAQLRACGKAVSPDLALEMIEDYADRDDPDALILFGTLYDGTELDPQVENLIGLTFDADDAKAAEYYSRAAQSGADGAGERLDATCARLQGEDSTLARGAYDDFCG